MQPENVSHGFQAAFVDGGRLILRRFFERQRLLVKRIRRRFISKTAQWHKMCHVFIGVKQQVVAFADDARHGCPMVKGMLFVGFFVAQTFGRQGERELPPIQRRENLLRPLLPTPKHIAGNQQRRRGKPID